MNYSIVVSDNFKRESKQLIKKYPSLKSELAELAVVLTKSPTSGINLGNSVYKIKIPVASKNRGKSGGARIITYVKVMYETVYLLSIYDKSTKVNISDKEIKDIMKDYL